jgi:hypothetical protein
MRSSRDRRGHRVAPELIIIAGDPFHSVRPTNQAILVAYQQLYRLRRPCHSPVILISGNRLPVREAGSILSCSDAGVEVVDEGALHRCTSATSAGRVHEALVGSARPALARRV